MEANTKKKHLIVGVRLITVAVLIAHSTGAEWIARTKDWAVYP